MNPEERVHRLERHFFTSAGSSPDRGPAHAAYGAGGSSMVCFGAVYEGESLREEVEVCRGKEKLEGVRKKKIGCSVGSHSQ